MAAFSDQIQTERFAQGLTLAELARRTHISEGYLALLENGTESTTRPSADILYRIVVALGTWVGRLHKVPLPRIGGLHERSLPLHRIDAAVDAVVGAFHEKPLPRISEDVSDVSTGRRAGTQQVHLRDDDSKLLAHIRYRGARPQSADD